MFLWMWGLKGWTGNIRWKKSFSFFNSRGRVSDTDASFVRLTHGWGMELLCGVERFHHKNRKESPLQAAGTEQRESLNMPVQSVESPVESNWLQSSRDPLLDMQRLSCDCEKPWRPFSLKGRTGGDMGCPLQGARRSSEVSPPHNVTNPSGMTLLHTPPSPSFHVLRQMSEDPSPGTTTGKDGDRVDSASDGFSLHHFTLISPMLSSVPFFFSFFLRLQALSAHFVTTGLLPGSRPDIRHMSSCRPWPHCLKPDVVWGLNWRTTVTHCQQPFLCLILCLLQWWRKHSDPSLE